jgi:hypothetical protein
VKIEELSFKSIFPIDIFANTNPSSLAIGWYDFVGSGGSIIMEVRPDGTSRSAMISSAHDSDIDYLFREDINWF